MKVGSQRRMCETADVASALGLPQIGAILPSLQFSRGASGSWLLVPFSTWPSRMVPPEDSLSPPGSLLLQLLVERPNSGCQPWWPKGCVCGGLSSQVLGTALPEGGRGVPTDSPRPPGLRGAFL